ncbi:MAG: 30S ribosomal protein S5 [Candidatus Kapabacteria bacterium]|nr:30S ribosomal protein S5 [Candidatus Kapabacteria bacterium]MCS7170325.1 30S ribosomal protein S5 [Candidatus Kapabacteria bacterium]MDW7997510.1 30S ribosomal protein S5 [Bacteroidota bacterium]MDW8224696.1 30S ribosomal protein S5 [Bacteroidota bacterium]
MGRFIKTPRLRIPGELELKEKLVYVGRTAKVVAGGRRFNFTALVVVGDGNGHVGFGMGKAGEVTDAVAKATEAARKSILRIQLHGSTIPHEVYAKYKTAKVLLRPAARGTGVIAAGGVRAVLELAGVQDVLTKCLGSTNPHNVVKATLKALLTLEDAHSVARRLGIPVEKVLYGKQRDSHANQAQDSAGT